MRQFIVEEKEIKEREKFYNYIIKNYNFKSIFSKEKMINNKFPFVIDFDENKFLICSSITCLACAAYNNKIISIKEFMNLNIV